MGKALARLAPAVVAVLAIGLGAGSSQAHNDWGLPLVGGLVGGYGLSYMMNKSGERKESAPREAAPTYAAPATVYAVPVSPAAPPPAGGSTASTVEHQLNVLDDLAAKGYITKDEYQSRRQALLNQL